MEAKRVFGLQHACDMTKNKLLAYYDANVCTGCVGEKVGVDKDWLGTRTSNPIARQCSCSTATLPEPS